MRHPRRADGLRVACLLGAVMLAWVGAFAQPHAEETDKHPIRIIGHPTDPAARLTPRDVRDIFLGIRRTWPDGCPTLPAVLEAGEIQEAFLERWVGKSPKQFRRYWRQMIFSGKGISPPAFAGQEDLLAYVAQTEGAIAFIADSLATELPDGVIVVASDPREVKR